MLKHTKPQLEHPMDMLHEKHEKSQGFNTFMHVEQHFGSFYVNLDNFFQYVFGVHLNF